VLYTDKAHTTGGRDGASRSSDGRLDIKLSSPGRPGSGTNPEQLFAAGWSACFMGAMGLAAAKMKTRLPADAAIDDEVDLCDTGGEDFLLRHGRCCYRVMRRQVSSMNCSIRATSMAGASSWQ
jgi:osmotically inducible protein OsmC